MRVPADVARFTEGVPAHDGVMTGVVPTYLAGLACRQTTGYSALTLYAEFTLVTVDACAGIDGLAPAVPAYDAVVTGDGDTRIVGGHTYSMGTDPALCTKAFGGTRLAKSCLGGRRHDARVVGTSGQTKCRKNKRISFGGHEIILHKKLEVTCTSKSV